MMLKLKYLFDNRDLAMMLIENWEYDSDSLELFKYFRISSNAIYPFKTDGKLRFLRISPNEEKSIKSLEGEIEILDTLLSRGYSVPKVIESKGLRKIESKATPWGDYHAIVLEGVGANSLENTDLNSDICYNYGKFLGEFHNISKTCELGKIHRDSAITRLESYISLALQSDEIIQKEYEFIKSKLEKLDRSVDTFGLIHYDFELDNIMYDSETSSMYAIDFDDAMIGWYGQDIERALRSLKDETESEAYEHFETSFLEGYRATGNSTSDYIENKDIFKRFAELYKYFRITNSLEESWDNEPEWMQNLRRILDSRIKTYKDGLCS